MRVVRIVAEWRKDGHRESAYKFCLVCGLNTDALIADGEWMGYIKEDQTYWPFILRNGNACFYGGNEPWSERTNIGQRPMRVEKCSPSTPQSPARGPIHTKSLAAIYMRKANPSTKRTATGKLVSGAHVKRSAGRRFSKEQAMTTTYRQGPVGALMDEYERAAGELERILEAISDENYTLIRDTETKDDDCRSIQTVVTHVIAAGYGYAVMLRGSLGIGHIGRWDEAVGRPDAAAKLKEMLEYTCETLDGRWNLSQEEANSLQIRSGWGPVYDFEQLFEHAIVHVLRHRRQIERFLGRS
jgi:hypothetical protein